MTSTPTLSEPATTRAAVASAPYKRPTTPWYQREVAGRTVKLDEVMNFSRQAASFLRAGVPILDALAVVGEENASKKMQEVLTDLQIRLRAGSSFGDAIAQHSKVFPGYYVAIVRSAELTGRLDDALDQLSEYLERELALRKELKGALTYPLIVLALAVVAIVIMSVYILPKFKNFYQGLNATLPLPTRMLINMTAFISEWWWLILAIVGVFVILVALVFGGKRGKERRDKMLLRMPVVGPLVNLVAVERFCRVLAALTHTGVNLPDAVQVAADSTNNRVFQNKLAVAREAMMRGEGLARPIQTTNIFPPAARQMIRVGESTGSLDVQLQNAATFYERELKYRLKRTTDMFEPAIILIVGGAVAFVAIAQISAMYSVYSQIDV